LHHHRYKKGRNGNEKDTKKSKIALMRMILNYKKDIMLSITYLNENDYH
jgi:hypothetical protein